MLLAQVVDWLVLVDLHTGDDVAVSVQKEGERAGQVLAAMKTNNNPNEILNTIKPLQTPRGLFRSFLVMTGVLQTGNCTAQKHHFPVLNECVLLEAVE